MHDLYPPLHAYVMLTQVVLNHVEAFIIFSTLRKIATTITSHPVPAIPTTATGTSSSNSSNSSSRSSIAVPSHVHDAAGQQLADNTTGSDNPGNNCMSALRITYVC
jgi:hypothetical protein